MEVICNYNIPLRGGLRGLQGKVRWNYRFSHLNQNVLPFAPPIHKRVLVTCGPLRFVTSEEDFAGIFPGIPRLVVGTVRKFWQVTIDASIQKRLWLATLVGLSSHTRGYL